MNHIHTQLYMRYTMESIRWAFKFGCCKPTRSEWLLAAQCVQPEEKARIGKFVFTKDGKSAMAGRLLMRKAVSDTLQIPWNEVKLSRTDKGKPYLVNAVPQIFPNFNFNVSHQGDYCVLAAEPALQVGVDVMKVEQPNRTNVPEFFHTMRKQFTEHEWKTIKKPNTEWKQLEMFYRHWCLKESYIKAIGIGLGFDLLRLDFHIATEQLCINNMTEDTVVYVDGIVDKGWHFEETKLDDKHVVAVALQMTPSLQHGCSVVNGPNEGTVSPPFQLLDFTELMSNAIPLLPADEDYWQAFDTKIERYVPSSKS